MSETTEPPLIPASIGPIRIDPAALYTHHTLILTLDISGETITRAVRRGELSAVRRGRHLFIRGEALLAWLTPTTSAPAGCEVRR
jgi:excisionase family DNA binding protein